MQTCILPSTRHPTAHDSWLHALHFAVSTSSTAAHFSVLRLIGFRPETDDGSPDIGHALSDQTERFAHVRQAKAMPHSEGAHAWYRQPNRSKPPRYRRAAR